MFGSLLKMFWPSQATIKKDLKSINGIIKESSKKAIPLPAKELELCSNKTTPKKKIAGLANYYIGSIDTIYHETIAAYGYRRYYKSPINAVLLLLDGERQYYYRIKKKTVDVLIDGQWIARILPDERILNKRKRVIGYWDKEDLTSPTLHVGKEHYMIMNNKEHNGRAIQIITKVDDHSILLFKAVLFYKLISKHLYN